MGFGRLTNFVVALGASFLGFLLAVGSVGCALLLAFGLGEVCVGVLPAVAQRLLDVLEVAGGACLRGTLGALRCASCTSSCSVCSARRSGSGASGGPQGVHGRASGLAEATSLLHLAVPH